MKEDLISYIEEQAKIYWEMADDIFDHPEMGFHEYFASGLLATWLEKNGFSVDRGVGGLETAFRAVFKTGEGGPRIGLLCEYDALPMGHACGHHMQGPIMLMAADALKHAELHMPYQLIIYGTPAEEGHQGKVRMMNAGCFQDIDIALMTHASPNTTVDVKSLAGSKWMFTYKGIAAHEALTPELNRSAMDAMLLTFQGIEFLRGHVKEDVKFYCSIIECTGTPNNLDSTVAKCQIAVRTYQSWDVAELEQRVKDVAEGAAKMTGTTVTAEKISESMGKLPSYSLNQLIMKNARALNAPQLLSFRKRTGGTDFAEITHMMPGAVARFAFVPEGSTSHSQVFLDYGKSENAHKGMVSSAQILVCTICDLIENPPVLIEVLEEFNKNKEEFEALCVKHKTVKQWENR